MIFGLPPAEVLLPLMLLLLLPLAEPSSSSQNSTSEEEIADNEGPVVRVAQGVLRGHRMQRPQGSSPRTIYAFEGVPYARPPTGSRRFKDPEEPEPWNGVRNATTFGSNCIQRNIDTGIVSGEEDCLFLNIYTADPPSKWTVQKRPVLVFIHGGTFVQSSGDMRGASPDLLVRQGVIFVIFNYRLGVMGFLNTEDSQIPGNAGVKDQVMVLRWVQGNIAAFGGDPNNVTIIGTSAGACSVHYLMLSPLSKGLFQSAVSTSGTALASWAVLDNPRKTALAIRRRWASACPQDAEDSIVSCLQRIDARELVANQYDIPTEQYRYFYWNSYYVPSVETPGSSSAPLITAHPGKLLKEGRFEKVPYVTGFTSSDGMLYIPYGGLLNNSSRWVELDEHFEDIFHWEMPFGVPRTREVARQVRNFYFGNQTLRDALGNLDKLERYVQMITDIYHYVCNIQAARLMSENGGEVFVYRFSRDGPLGFFKQAVNLTRIPGVMHGDDMPYIFDFLSNGIPIPIPASEQTIRERQAKIFTNVAKFGNPTPVGSGLLDWPAFSSQNQTYMDMDVDLSLQDISQEERLAFWTSLITSSKE